MNIFYLFMEIFWLHLSENIGLYNLILKTTANPRDDFEVTVWLWQFQTSILTNSKTVPYDNWKEQKFLTKSIWQ